MFLYPIFNELKKNMAEVKVVIVETGATKGMSASEKEKLNEQIKKDVNTTLDINDLLLFKNQLKIKLKQAEKTHNSALKKTEKLILSLNKYSFFSSKNKRTKRLNDQKNSTSYHLDELKTITKKLKDNISEIEYYIKERHQNGKSINLKNDSKYQKDLNKELRNEYDSKQLSIIRKENAALFNTVNIDIDGFVFFEKGAPKRKTSIKNIKAYLNKKEENINYNDISKLENKAKKKYNTILKPIEIKSIIDNAADKITKTLAQKNKGTKRKDIKKAVRQALLFSAIALDVYNNLKTKYDTVQKVLTKEKAMLNNILQKINHLEELKNKKSFFRLFRSPEHIIDLKLQYLKDYSNQLNTRVKNKHRILSLTRSFIDQSIRNYNESRKEVVNKLQNEESKILLNRALTAFEKKLSKTEGFKTKTLTAGGYNKPETEGDLKKVTFFDGDKNFKILPNLLDLELNKLETSRKEIAPLMQENKELELAFTNHYNFVKKPSGNDRLWLPKSLNAEILYQSKEEDLANGAPLHADSSNIKKSDISFITVHSSYVSSDDKKILRSEIKKGKGKQVIASDELLKKAIDQTKDDGTIVLLTCYAGGVIPNIKPALLKEIKERNIQVIVGGDSENMIYSSTTAVTNVLSEIIKNDTEKPENIFDKHFAETFHFFDHAHERWEKREAVEFNKEDKIFYRQKYYFNFENSAWENVGKIDVTDKVKDTKNSLSTNLLLLPLFKGFDIQKANDFYKNIQFLYNKSDSLPHVSYSNDWCDILTFATRCDGRYKNHVAEAVINNFDKKMIQESFSLEHFNSIRLFLGIVNILNLGNEKRYESITEALKTKFNRLIGLKFLMKILSLK